jgi:hypothetical protein
MTGPIRPIRIEGDVAYVTLTQGYEAIIDAADVLLVEGFNWSAHVNGHTVYGIRSKRNGTKNISILLHRAIMGDPNGMEIDHEDGDGLNNRKANLRMATRAENARNRRKNQNNTSGVKSVDWDPVRKKWRARIKVDGKIHYLGRYETIEMAKTAYVAASEKMHGEFGRAA